MNGSAHSLPVGAQSCPFGRLRAQSLSRGCALGRGATREGRSETAPLRRTFVGSDPNRPLSVYAGAPLFRAFTLLELLVVIGLMAALSAVLFGGLRGSGKAAALQSGQATLANLVTSARTKAMATGQSARLLVDIDPVDSGPPVRFLRYLAVQVQQQGGWTTVTEAYLPEGVYVIPGNFSVPAGLFASGTAAPWTKVDGSALRSTALRANAFTTDTINGAGPTEYAAITISANAGTAQSGDLILALGRLRSPGTYQPGESPVELENPERVRGLTLSAYGVPAMINQRASF